MSWLEDHDGARISVGCMRLGSWGAGYDTAAYLKFIEGCLEAGASIFDHADIYGDYTTEEDFGKALEQAPSLRSSMKLISKCGIRMVSANRPGHLLKSYDSSREHIIRSAENSLKMLQTDWLDLLLLHRPDMLLNPQEVAEAFERLREAGKVRHFGVSNFSPAQVAALSSSWPDLEVNQIEISPLQRNAFLDGSLDQCLEFGITPMAWSPLSGGQIFQEVPLSEVLSGLSGKYGASVDALIYAWLLRHPSGIVPVTGTARVARVRSALAASEISMEAEDWYAIWTAAGGEVP